MAKRYKIIGGCSFHGFEIGEVVTLESGTKDTRDNTARFCNRKGLGQWVQLKDVKKETLFSRIRNWRRKS